MMTGVITTLEHWSNGVMGKKLNWPSFISSAIPYSNTPVLQYSKFELTNTAENFGTIHINYTIQHF
jgi:hypothetical protein